MTENFHKEKNSGEIVGKRGQIGTEKDPDPARYVALVPLEGHVGRNCSQARWSLGGATLGNGALR